MSRRPTLDGPAHNVRLHFLYAGGRRTTFISITFTFTAPRTLRATTRLAPLPTLPKSASGLSGAPHAAGYLPPHRAANAAFLFIGPGGPAGGGYFAGNPAPFRAAAQALAPLPALRATPRPAPPLMLPKSASGPTGGGHSAGNPAPRRATHVVFFFIGLAGFPAPRTPPEPPHPAPPRTLLFSLLALAGVALRLTCRDNFAAIFLPTYRIIVVLS